MMNFSFSQDGGHVKICHNFNFELKMIQKFPSEAYFANQIIVCVLSLFISLSTIFLNLATIITFRSSSQLQKKVCHFLIYVQSFNDLGIGLMAAPLFSALLASELVGSPNCDVYLAFFFIFYTTAGFSVVILSAMNLERYASIVHPVYHRNKVTKKKLLIYIFAFSSLFLCVSIASLVLRKNILNKFSGYVFLLHFVSIVYLYTRIFLVGKAQFKRSEPRRNAPRTNAQNQANHIPMHQENRHGNRSDNQGNLSDNQGNTSNTQAMSLSDNQDGRQGGQLDKQSNQTGDQKQSSDNQEKSSDNHDGRQGKQSDNQEAQSDNQGEQSGNQEAQSDKQSNLTGDQKHSSDNHEKSSDNQRNRSDNQDERQGEQSDNQREQSDKQSNQGHLSENQEKPSDNQGKSSDTQGKPSNSQNKPLNNQGRKQSYYPDRRSNNQDRLSDNQERPLNNQERSSDSQDRPSDNQDSNRSCKQAERNQRKKETSQQSKLNEQEFLMKFKLAKSCLIVVLCSFISFLLPTVFQPLEISEFNEIILDGWFTILVLLNSTLDSLIFFWKNNLLRSEAKKVLNNILS